jgi:hypothetical protein
MKGMPQQPRGETQRMSGGGYRRTGPPLLRFQFQIVRVLLQGNGCAERGAGSGARGVRWEVVAVDHGLAGMGGGAEGPQAGLMRKKESSWAGASEMTEGTSYCHS